MTKKMTPGLFSKGQMSHTHPKWEQSLQRGREYFPHEEKPDETRSPFYRDYSRILHCTSYRRLKHKTQVFFATQNDHICTRMEHVNHVASISYTISKFMGLNTELTQAIALGHDLGHSPFGHEGETLLSEIMQQWDGSFWHEKNGLYTADKIATLPNAYGIHKNLRLTYAVRDGIISHCGETDENGLYPRVQAVDLEQIERPNQYMPYTWEGCVVKLSDKIAYLGRDIEDAIELNLLEPDRLEQLNKLLRKVPLPRGVEDNKPLVAILRPPGVCLILCLAGQSAQFIDLNELQFHRGGATEDQHGHAQAALLVVDFLDHAVEVVERAVDHADHLARFEQHLRLRLLHAVLDALEDRIGLVVLDR